MALNALGPPAWAGHPGVHPAGVLAIMAAPDPPLRAGHCIQQAFHLSLAWGAACGEAMGTRNPLPLCFSQRPRVPDSSLSTCGGHAWTKSLTPVPFLSPVYWTSHTLRSERVLPGPELPLPGPLWTSTNSKQATRSVAISPGFVSITRDLCPCHRTHSKCPGHHGWGCVVTDAGAHGSPAHELAHTISDIQPFKLPHMQPFTHHSTHMTFTHTAFYTNLHTPRGSRGRHRPGGCTT